MIVLRWIARLRMHRIARQLAAPRATQEATLQTILCNLRDTRQARDLNLPTTLDADSFRAGVPVHDYAYYAPYINAIAQGERSVLTRDAPVWMGQTGGTTNDPKPVPVNRDLLRAYRRFNRDMLFRYAVERQRFAFLDRRLYVIAAIPTGEKTAGGTPLARATSIMTRSAPWFMRRRYVPGNAAQTGLDAKQKVSRACTDGWRHRELIRMAVGMTPNLLSAWEHLLEHARNRGMDDPVLSDVLPNLQVAFHGGSSFSLYQSNMQAMTGNTIDQRNVYASVETPIAYQWSQDDPGLVPALDVAFLEFLPEDQEAAPHPHTRLIDEVETGVAYSVLLTTRGGLLRYRIGDRVMFTALDPPRLKVLGREVERLDLCGEKLNVEQAECALAEAGSRCAATVADFAACPAVDSAGDPRIAHQWVIETETPPPDATRFAAALDTALGACNPWYATLRVEDALLEEPEVIFVPPGTFRRYMDHCLTYGQQKVLHLQPDRSRIDALLAEASTG